MRRRLAVISLAVGLVAVGVPVMAVDSGTVTGTGGADGADGTATLVHNQDGTISWRVTPGGPGGAGAAAGNSAISDDTKNSAQAVGGAGGNGGHGAAGGLSASSGGDGGVGGNASASARHQNDDQLFNAQDYSTAVGGNGGAGGNGGSVRFGPSGNGGRGGDGGSASASASAMVYGTDYMLMTIQAGARGGSGGEGGSINGTGGNGGVATLGAVFGQIDGYGTPNVSGGVQGGNGGHGVGGGAGGNGASESLTNAISAVTSSHDNDLDITGEIAQISQSAGGGDSGGSNGGNPGLAGAGSSTINYLGSNFNYNFTATTLATGGKGGDCQNTTGGAGGEATSVCQVGGQRNVIANAYANCDYPGPFYDGGSKGSDITSGFNLSAGAGGNASATAVANDTGTSDDHAEASASAAGGGGGNVTGSATGNGGSGGNATASANATGNGDTAFDLTPNAPAVQVVAEAIGGPGGQAQGVGFAAGNGGSASLGNVGGVSTASGSSLLSITAHIIGGSGGGGANGANGGNGANATLNNAITSASAPLTMALEQEADGGDAGGSLGAAPGLAGNATSSFSYNSSTNPVVPNQLTVDVYARGGSGGNSDSGAASTGGSSTANASITSKYTVFVDSEAGFETFPSAGQIYPEGGANGGWAIGNAGTAAIGGNSSAATVANSTSGFCSAGAEAVGGTGGGVSTGVIGNGADGANATASVNATAYGGAEIDVTSIGGTGGNGNGAGCHGGNGAAASFGSINGVLTVGGRITVNDTLIGGNGGAGLDGANGGNGASVLLANTFNLINPGNPLITQMAVGGTSGGASGANPGAPGVAGNASSNLTFSAVQSVDGTSIAIAGSGGDTWGSIGSRSGDANAIADLSSQNNAISIAETNFDYKIYGTLILSHGSTFLEAPGLSAGDGGNANGSATATSTGTNPGDCAAQATANIYGAAGGSAAGVPTGNGGNGGNATANASATTAGPDTALASAYAYGGPGGTGSGSGFVTGNGGSATGSATATAQTTGSAVALAQANSGAPGRVNNSANAGHAGSTSVMARANSTGRFRWLTSSAQTPAGAQTQSQAQAIYGNSSPGFGSLFSFQSASAISAPAEQQDVTAGWTNAVQVQNAFAHDASNVNAVLVGVMQTPAIVSGPATYSTSFEIDQANAQLNSNGIIVGMVAAQSVGAGLQPGDSLRFRLQRNGITLLDQTYGANSLMQAAIENSVYLLGPQDADLGGRDLDLRFLFDLTSSHASTGVGLEFLLGNVTGTQSGVWSNAAGGTWTIPTNWSANALPIGPGASAVFGSAITSPSTITLDENTTVGSLDFDNNNAYTIAKGSGNYSLTLDNAGADPTINVTAGHHEIAANLNLGNSTDITINPNTSLKLSGHLSGGLNSLVIGGSTNAWNGQLDLTNNDLIIHSQALEIANLINQIKQGYDHGHWDGEGIIASAAAVNAGTGLAIELNNDGAGHPLLTTFDGQSAVAADVLIKYTWLGDANLDGVVNSADLALMQSNGTQWNQGDFNYDGKVNGDDYALLMLGQAESGGANISNTVPEPAAIFLLAGLFAVRPARRRRVPAPA